MAWRLIFTVPFLICCATSYAYFEANLNPCALLPWCTYQWDGLAFYQYGFMFPLFAVIAIIPVWRDFSFRGYENLQAFGSFLLLVLGEDSIYFVIQRTEISPGLYTTQWGYLPIFGFVIPYWYLYFGIGAIASLYFSYVWRKGGHPPFLQGNQEIPMGKTGSRQIIRRKRSESEQRIK